MQYKTMVSTRRTRNTFTVLALTLLCALTTTNGFTQQQRPLFGASSTRTVESTAAIYAGPSSSSSSLAASPLSPDDMATAGTQLATMIPNLLVASSSSSMQATTPSPASTNLDPAVVESQVLYGMAHVALDFAPNMLTSVSKAIIRLTAVVGRIFVLSADYLPDQSIHTEELLIQLCLMGLAVKDLMVTTTTTENNNNNNNKSASQEA